MRVGVFDPAVQHQHQPPRRIAAAQAFAEVELEPVVAGVAGEARVGRRRGVAAVDVTQVLEQVAAAVAAGRLGVDRGGEGVGLAGGEGSGAGEALVRVDLPLRRVVVDPQVELVEVADLLERFGDAQQVAAVARPHQLRRDAHVLGRIGRRVFAGSGEEAEAADAEEVGDEGEALAVPAEQDRAGGRLALDLGDLPQLAGGHLELALEHRVGPAQADVVGLAGGAEAEVQPPRRAAEVAAGGLQAPELAALPGLQLDQQADGVGLRPGARFGVRLARQDLQPAPARDRRRAPQLGRGAGAGHQQLERAIAVEVGGHRAAAARPGGAVAEGNRRMEAAVAVAGEDPVAVAVGAAGVEQDQVEVAVEVEVAQEGAGGAAEGVQGRGEARVRLVGPALPLQQQQRRVGAAQEQQVLAAVLVEVAADQAVAVAGAGQGREAVAGVAVAADAVVEEDLVVGAVVEEQQVEVAVVVEVGEGHRQGGPVAAVDAGSGRDVEEAAVAVVAPQGVGGAAPGSVGRPEARHGEVEVAVVVGVGPGGADAGPVAAGDAAGGGDVGEGAAAVVAVEPVGTGPAQEQVGVAVLVVVAEEGADGAPAVDAAVGHGGEVAPLVEIERAAAAFAGGREEQVEVAVAVDVGHRGAGTEGRRAGAGGAAGPAGLTGGAAVEPGQRRPVPEGGRLRQVRGRRGPLEGPDDAGVAAHLAVLHAGQFPGLGVLEGPEAVQELAGALGLALLAQQRRQPVAGRLVVRHLLQGPLQMEARRRRVVLLGQDPELVVGVGVVGVGLQHPLEQRLGFRGAVDVAQQHAQRVEGGEVAWLALDDPAQLGLGARPRGLVVDVQQGDAEVQPSRRPPWSQPDHLLEGLDRRLGLEALHQADALVEAPRHLVEVFGRDAGGRRRRVLAAAGEQAQEQSRNRQQPPSHRRSSLARSIAARLCSTRRSSWSVHWPGG